MSHSLRYLVNCSVLFTEVPLLERPAAAKAAGFDAVEFWWPFAKPVPSDKEVDAFIQSITDAGVRLSVLNFFEGDLAGPDLGLMSIPSRSQEFRDSVEVAVGIATLLHTEAFNAVYGNRIEGIAPDHQDEVGLQNLGMAADAVALIDAKILVEPLSSFKPYPLRTASDGMAVVRRAHSAGFPNVGLLMDIFHLATNGDDIDAAIDSYAKDIAHVQIADFPGRRQPGTGELPIERYLTALEAKGYDGWICLEYKPTVPTLESLAFLPRSRRASTT